MKLLAGKNKFGETVELGILEDKLTVEVKENNDGEKKSRKKDKEESGFGSYSNSFDRKNSLEMKGVKSLPDNKCEVTLKFAGENRRFVFVVNQPYQEVMELLS